MKNLKHFGKRGLAVLIALVMCVGLLPVTAFAAPQTITGGNDVTSNGITISPSSKPSDWTYGSIGGDGKLNNNGGSIVKKVGESGFYRRCPTNRLVGQNCGHVVAEYTSDYYIDITAELTDGDIIKNWGYSVGTWDSTYGSCLQADFTAAKPGQTRATITYYVNFMVRAETGYCNCGAYTRIPQDYTWHKYSDYFDITVNARYQLTYDTDGGSSVDSTTDTVAATSTTLNVTSTTPTKTGFKFLGWSEAPGATAATYTGGESITLNWVSGPTVEKTLYAVWEPDEHVHDYTWTPNGDKTHNGTCSNADGKCEMTSVTNEACADTTGDGFCDKCGADMREDTTYTLTYVAQTAHKDEVQGLPMKQTETNKTGSCTFTIPSNPPTRANHTFLYWIGTGTYKGAYNPGGTVTLQAANPNLELTAYWTCNGTHVDKDDDGLCDNDNCDKPVQPSNQHTFTITYKGNGGTVNGEDEHTETVTTDKNWYVFDYLTAVRDGYKFNGWDNGITASVGNPNVETSAKWVCDGNHNDGGDGFCDKGDCGACTHAPNGCGNECNHPGDCPCKHQHTDANNDGICDADGCKHCLHNHTTAVECPEHWNGDTKLCDNDNCLKPSHKHTDGDDDGKCDEDGACMHDKGQCGSECGHDDDCQCKHQHADANNDGKCDVCGKCLHEKDAAGYCTMEGCTHGTDCCVKDPGKHQHKDEEPKDGKCDECGACMHKHEDGYCVDPDCKGTGDHSQCCTKKKAPQVTISNRYAPITVNNGVATAPYTVTVKNESGYPLYSLDIKDKLTTTVYQHGTTTPTDAVEIKVIPVDVTLNGTSIKDKVDLGGERTVSANATTNLQWTVLKGNETFADDAVVTLTYNVTIRLTGNVGVDYRFNNTAKGVTDTEYKPAPEVAMASYQAPVYFEKFETEETNTGAGNIPDSDPDPVTPPSGGDTGTGGTLLPDSGGNQGGGNQGGGNQGGGNQGGGNQGGGNQGGGNDPDDIYIPDDPTPLNPTPVTPPEVEIDDPATPLASANGLNSVDHFAYIAGYTDGTVRPESNITRAEVATIFYRLMTDVYRAANWSDTNDFSDVNAGDWFNNAVSTCAKAGIVSGYSNGTFAPNQAITRAEFATIAARFLDEEITGENAEGFSDIDGHWAKANILRAAEAGWVNGDNGRFRPDNYITRAEVMTIVNRMLNRLADKEHMLDDMKVWPDNPETAWYYEAVQEATNSHQYESLEETHDWTELDEDPDWSALEKEWAAG